MAASLACDAEPDVAARRIGEDPLHGAGGSGNLGSGGSLGGAPGVPTPLTLSGDLEAHDPDLVVTPEGYFVFSTGNLISTKASSDLLAWRTTEPVFSELPLWVDERLSGVTDLWAPDVSFLGGKYHLYYAASTYGTGVSCIGHATAPELTETTTWLDEGEVICSDVDELVDWDAIDPSTFVDEAGSSWMVFGSYSSGIKLIPLDEKGARSGVELYSLASRPAEEAIQAPSMLFYAGFYYLFASFDQCCAGVNSTSNIRVGRSDKVTGPFLDKEGTPLLEGGGSPFIVGNDNFRGAGASSIVQFGDTLLTVYHAYDASLAGQATLRIAPLVFDDDGWPVPHDP